MGLDTKYRPQTYSDVIGQKGTISVLKEIVRLGNGYHQSYVFEGAFGSGKTTLGRILARSLLCQSPVDGEPCDVCQSCKDVLSGTSLDCVEFDAASNSGADAIRALVDEIQYTTFSGKRRIYIVDEAHRLSKTAIEQLLKPLEDTLPGSMDKRMVCIFCTTEPEALGSTIFSRCAPSFTIHTNTPDEIAARLADVCKAEGISYDIDTLRLIAENAECHVRDCLKALEAIASRGAHRDVVVDYLKLGTYTDILNMLATVPTDVAKSIALASTLLKTISPSSLYEKCLVCLMIAYKAHLGVSKPPLYLQGPGMDVLSQLGPTLLDIARTFSTRPNRPTESMFVCDIADIYDSIHAPKRSHTVVMPSRPEGPQKPDAPVETPTLVDGVYINPKGVRRVLASSNGEPKQSVKAQAMSLVEFTRLLKVRYLEKVDGRKGLSNMGESRVDSPGDAEG